jgi:pyridoxal phosphate enzyme (YggS family)|tara:strand:- start:96 stop:752 length:657 start_codon:yes stop_codon:yes gene_type:complete
MKHNVINKYLAIQENIKKNKTDHHKVNIISVSKTFDIDKIMPLIEHGNIHFGENKVQEAENKWKDIIKNNPSINLHMIGKLQSNKAKKAVELFNYIHSLDSKKLADELSKREKNLNKKLKYFIQVNIGNEDQKSGIPFNEVDQFYDYCSKNINLNVIGLMAIPPNDENIEINFKCLYEANLSLGLKELSMGMSNDYLKALKYNPTFLRIGSAIFGKRD